MSKYRIVEVTFDSGRREYRVQKRVLFFWVNAIDDYHVGDGIFRRYAHYDTYKDAATFIEWKIEDAKKKRARDRVKSKTTFGYYE